MESHEGQVEKQRPGLVMAPDDVNGFLGEHVGGKHLLKVPGHALVPPEVVAHLARAKLDGGAGDHPGPVVH